MTLAVGPAQSAGADSPPTRSELQSQADDIVAAGAPGVVVEVRDEDGAWTGVAGVGDIAFGSAPDAEGRFRVGSVTKTFTATMVMQLVAEQRVELDASIDDYLPGLLPYQETITVRELLQHRSGLVDYKELVWPNVQSVRKQRFVSYAPVDLVDIATEHPLDFPPGTDHAYSNTGYIVLGMLIEQVTGHDIRTELEHRILRPAGLSDTDLAGAFPFLPHAGMRGYEALGKSGGRLIDLTTYNMTVSWTAGAIVSTSADVNDFYAALLAGELLPDEQLAEMRQTVPSFPGFGYGLGLAGTELCGRQVWGHVGGSVGYVTYTFTDADVERQITITANRSLSADAAVGEALMSMIETEFCGEPPGA